MSDTVRHDFTDRVVVITGAASGMGAASTRLFGEAGATLALVDRDAGGLERVAGEVGAASTFVGDIANSEFCDAVVESVVETHRHIDVLVNAAGTIHRADVTGTSNSDWDRVMSVNVNAMFYLSRAAVLHMAAAGKGVIVNFGSIWGGVGSAGSTAYCVSKGAVHQLTRAMALDHVEQGIRVNAVAPGEVRTPMLSSEREEIPTEADLVAMAEATIPMKRLAEPIEIARVVLFLASDDASYMTGEIVHVDAGYTAR